MSDMLPDASGVDTHGALVPGPRCERGPTGSGSLDGLRAAVKDLIDVGGALTTGGNPDWAAAHVPAWHDAPLVARLRAAGASVTGKTVTDELAFSLEGRNVHHGTPRNPRAPHCLPGGSSSGSAVAVASGLVDVALGTDTGGSVRVPASFCGLYGMRPTHGRLTLDGVIPFAPSYDTVGWFARDAAMLQQTGHVLLEEGGHALVDASETSALTLHVATDTFAAIDAACSQMLLPIARRLAAEHNGRRLALDVTAFDGGPLSDWISAYQVLQGSEIRQQLGPWIQQHQPHFADDIAARFASVWDITDEDVARWSVWRAAQTRRLHEALSPGHVWLLPTSPTPPLPLTANADEVGRFYGTALALTSIAGHAGLPQLTMPLGSTPDGLPLGLSLLGARGSDETLLALARHLT